MTARVLDGAVASTCCCNINVISRREHHSLLLCICLCLSLLARLLRPHPS